MSIYATGWSIKLPVNEEHPSYWETFDRWYRKGVTKEYEVVAQFVPIHIGEEDDSHYSTFLPPRVTHDPETGKELPNRAVVLVQVGREKKDGQRYTDPLLVLPYLEYLKTPFDTLINRIHRELKPVSKAVLDEVYG